MKKIGLSLVIFGTITITAIMDFDLFRRPQFPAKVDYLRQCAKLRMVTQKFHTFGRLWEPVSPTNSIPTFEEEFSDGGLHKGKVPP